MFSITRYFPWKIQINTEYYSLSACYYFSLISCRNLLQQNRRPKFLHAHHIRLQGLSLSKPASLVVFPPQGAYNIVAVSTLLHQVYFNSACRGGWDSCMPAPWFAEPACATSRSLLTLPPAPKRPTWRVSLQKSQKSCLSGHFLFIIWIEEHPLLIVPDLRLGMMADESRPSGEMTATAFSSLKRIAN